ncbi:MAG: 4Fe-4S binding protein [Candidatus Woesearchaeota archaeon]
MPVKIDYDKCCWKEGKCTSCACGACDGCVEVCATGALERGDKIIVNNELCSSCGACVAACKHAAISLVD